MSYNHEITLFKMFNAVVSVITFLGENRKDLLK